MMELWTRRDLELSAEECEALWEQLDSLIPQGEHDPIAPGHLGRTPLQALMYFLRTGTREPFLSRMVE